MTTHIIDQRYDAKMHHPLTREYYGESDFFNFGYWREGIRTQKEASEHLIEKLLAFIPDHQGTILDVACGMGATTKHLLRSYAPAQVTALNISWKQLQTAQANIPHCAFVQMDAAKLAFGDAVFDNMICVEAMFHFNTRADFLGEAWRVLKPGGQLVLSDILVPRWAITWNSRIPTQNWVKDLTDYQALYHQAGFCNVKIIDATRECWISFYQHSMRWRRNKLRDKELSLATYAGMALRNYIADRGIHSYFLVSATKATSC